MEGFEEEHFVKEEIGEVVKMSKCKSFLFRIYKAALQFNIFIPSYIRSEKKIEQENRKDPVGSVRKHIHLAEPKSLSTEIRNL
jgi:hypothetical protein